MYLTNVKPMDKTKGFTLIELVVVILVLGIMAAIALPRFVEVAPEARIAALESLRGSLLSGASLANAQRPMPL